MERPIVQYIEMVNGVEVSRQEGVATDAFMKWLKV